METPAEYTSLDYLNLARTLASGEGPQSNAIFQALMLAHQHGRISALAVMASSIQREIKMVADYAGILRERLAQALDNDAQKAYNGNVR